MSLTKQERLKRLLILQHLRNNVVKLFPILRYATSENLFREQVQQLFAQISECWELTAVDFKFILSIPLEKLTRFSEGDLDKKITELQK